MTSPGTQARQSGDDELMQRIAEGEEAALELLYDRYGGLLFTICQRVIRDRDEAEEVLVDVFWEVWEKSERYDLSRGSPRTYLTMLARSRAIDRLRKTSSQPDPPGEPVDAAWREPESMRPGPQQTFADEETSQAVVAAVANLPDDEKQLIELAFFAGLSHREIAEQVMQPLGTIKSRIRRGLARLRDELNAFYEGGSQ